MTIRTEWVRFGDEQRYSGYRCVPERAAPPLPAVIVIQEAWGVTAHIEDVARRIAAAGYATIAPDLYAEHGARPEPLTNDRLLATGTFLRASPPTVWRDETAREAELAKLPSDEAARLRETFAAMTANILRLDKHLPALDATARYLRTESEASRGQKVGVMGFCMGGSASGLFACHDPELAAAAIFYGMPPAAERVKAIACPVLGFYGENDPFIIGNVPAFVEAMKAAGKSFEHHVYPGVGHAFYNDGGPSYDAGAVRDATPRLLAFFRQHLG
jgi:carboxymethylenebutenolidase